MGKRVVSWEEFVKAVSKTKCHCGAKSLELVDRMPWLQLDGWLCFRVKCSSCKGLWWCGLDLDKCSPSWIAEQTSGNP